MNQQSSVADLLAAGLVDLEGAEESTGFQGRSGRP
jgi:hypothetical protein